MPTSSNNNDINMAASESVNNDPNVGDASDGSEEEEDMFLGWEIADHRLEMEKLQDEFNKLKNQYHQQELERVESKIRGINNGSDPEFKKITQEIDAKASKQKKALELTRKFREAMTHAKFEGERQLAENTIEYNKRLVRQALLGQFRSGLLATPKFIERLLDKKEPEEAAEMETESPYKGNNSPTKSQNNTITEDTFFEAVAHTLEKAAQAGRISVDKPPRESGRTTNEHKKLKVTHDPPIIYELQQREIAADLRKLNRF
eukprot:m.11875 g.11875  ORF g.11875 m.11875 type:complete len:261 (+) comp4549_c0_seq1:320-1102(+)